MMYDILILTKKIPPVKDVYKINYAFLKINIIRAIMTGDGSLSHFNLIYYRIINTQNLTFSHIDKFDFLFKTISRNPHYGSK